MFTDDGKNLIAKFLGGTNDPPGFVAFGSDGTVPVVTDTVLGSEFGRTRVAMSTTTVFKNVVEYTAILPSTEPSGLQPVTFRETGVFTGSPTGSIYSRATFYDTEKNDNLEYQAIVQYRID